MMRNRRKRVSKERSLKPDVSQNGDTDMLVKQREEYEQKQRLYPLRIDKRTVIYVTEDKLTPEYAEKKRRLFNVKQESLPQKGGNSKCPLDIQALKGYIDKGMSVNSIAKQMGVSRTTVNKYVRKYNLRNEKE